MERRDAGTSILKHSWKPLGYCHLYLHLPFRQTEGLIKSHLKEKANTPVSIVTSPANEYDSTKFVDVMESIPEFTGDSMVEEILTVYADRGYDAKYIRMYLRNNGN